MRTATLRTAASARIALVIGASALLASCATGGGGTTDHVAAEKSRAYIEGMSFVLAGQASGVCALPTAAQKIAMSSTDGPSKEWRDLLAKASACAGEKNWKTLEQVAQTLARTDINAPWGAYFMSVAAEGTGDWARAMWMVELAQKKAGAPNGLFLYQHGRIWLGLKETAKAMADVQKAVSLEPKLTMGHLFLAQIHQRDLEWTPAAEHYVAALAADDKNWRALGGLAEVRYEMGQMDESAQLFSRALAWQPTRLDWWLRLGSIYEGQKKNEQALTTYKALRTSLEKGDVKQRPSIDVQAKIKALEESIATARQPATAKAAQASAVKPDEKRSKK